MDVRTAAAVADAALAAAAAMETVAAAERLAMVGQDVGASYCRRFAQEDRDRALRP